MGGFSVFSLDGVNTEMSIESTVSIFSTLIAPKLHREILAALVTEWALRARPRTRDRRSFASDRVFCLVFRLWSSVGCEAATHSTGFAARFPQVKFVLTQLTLNQIEVVFVSRGYYQKLKSAVL